MNEERFAEAHEWIRVDGDIGTVGITDFAQKALGDVVYVELPEVGTVLAKDDDAAVVESVKAASEVFTPVGGEIVEVNEKLNDDPALVNGDPEQEGWFFKLRLSDPSELGDLLTREEYQGFIEGLD